MADDTEPGGALDINPDRLARIARAADGSEPWTDAESAAHAEAAIVQQAKQRERDEEAMDDLAAEPERAADAMVMLLEAVLSKASQSIVNIDGWTDDELADCQRERDEAMVKFWMRCDQLVEMVVTRRPDDA